MKKLILLFLILGISYSIYGQAGWVKKYQIQGYYTEHAKGDTVAQNVVVMNPIPVTATIVGFSTSARQDTEKVYISYLKALITITNSKNDSLKAKLNLLIAKDYATSAKEDSLKTKLNDIKTLLSTQNLITNNLYVKRDTTKTAVDSISFGFTSKRLKIYNVSSSTDSVFFSSNKNFTTGTKISLLGSESCDMNYAISKIYFKGNTTHGKKFRIEVN
jgi:hypothetical protein